MFYKAKWLRWSNDCVRAGDCRKTTLNYIRFLPLGDFFLDDFFFPLTSSVLHFFFFSDFFGSSSEEPKTASSPKQSCCSFYKLD